MTHARGAVRVMCILLTCEEVDGPFAYNGGSAKVGSAHSQAAWQYPYTGIRPG